MSADHRPCVGDVRDVSIVSELVQPAVYDRVWQPDIAPWKPGHLLVAFGRHLRGAADMGDIVCAVSTDDGVSWDEPVTIFDHRVRMGALGVAYANPVLYRPPVQEIVWCFAMRCPAYYPERGQPTVRGVYGERWPLVAAGRIGRALSLPDHYMRGRG